MAGAYGRPIQDTRVTRESLTLCEVGMVPCEALNEWWWGQVILSAQADGTSAASIVLGLIRPISGTADGNSAADVSLSVTRGLIAQAEGGSSVQAALVTQLALAGSANGSATTTAALVISLGLAGQANGTSSAQVSFGNGPLVFPVRLRSYLVGG